MGERRVTGLPLLAGEFAITVSNGAFWVAIGQALVFGGVALTVGVWVARQVGFLANDAMAGETLGVGLATGLISLAAWWAAIASGGRSSFTPVAAGLAVAVAIAVVHRASPMADAETRRPLATDGRPRRNARRLLHSPLFLGYLAGAVFVVAVALLYGSTMAPSPRSGMQPVEFMDEAYYAVLGRDLATTGIETIYSPSGFERLDGLPAQTWYHWGELWLASAMISIFGTPPLPARFFIVLPLLLLATAAMTGTVVRRIARTDSRQAFLFGFIACLLLAPIPVIAGPFFSNWAAGQLFGITVYGLAAPAVLVALHSVTVLGTKNASWALETFVGCAIAVILPAHLAVAFIALLGVGSVWAIRVFRSLTAQGRWLPISSGWRRTVVIAGVILLMTVAWGMLTGHGLGNAVASSNVSAFNRSWAEPVAITFLGAGVLLASALAWPLVRKEAPVQAELYVGTGAIVVGGAIAWGARLSDFTTSYLFFGGIALFATPAAATAARTLWERLRKSRLRGAAPLLVTMCVVQIVSGVLTAIDRLQQFGPHSYVEVVGPLGDPRSVPILPPISVGLLDEIRRLPTNAKLAYSCEPFDEVGFGDPRLLSIDAHTARRVIPMCFEAEILTSLIGAERSLEVPNAFFQFAPQRRLYPDAAARPSAASIAAFLKANGIDYIYADALHPNTLLADAVPVAAIGGATVLRVP
jgi:hypothetical protein